jgi:putative ABC transport system permease protein
VTFTTLILKGIGRNKLRSFLILLSISIAFLLYGLLSGFNHVINHGSDSAGNELLVHNSANLMVGLPVSHGPQIASVEGVEAVTSATLIGSYFRDPAQPVPLLMVDAPSHLRVFGADMEVIEGGVEAFIARRDAILINEELARQHGWRPGGDVPLFSGLYMFSDSTMVWPFHVAGIYRARPGAPAMPFALGHLDYLDQSSPNWMGRVHWFTLRTRDAAANDQVAALVDSRFANSEAATKTQSANMMARAFFAQIGNISLLITIIVGSAFVTILLIAGNTMALAVRRRTNEIGVMRVLGFSRARIFGWILGEALLVATIGGAAGLLIAAAILPTLTAELEGGDALVGLPLPVLTSGFGLMLLVGLLTGLLPALRSMRLVPADALKRLS